MKALKIAPLFAGLMTLASTAFASSGEASHSGLLVWSFIGFCGLVIAFQFIPALMVVVGALKGVFAPAEKAAVNSDN